MGFKSVKSFFFLFGGFGFPKYFLGETGRPVIFYVIFWLFSFVFD
jgi:hypothetical protein